MGVFSGGCSGPVSGDTFRIQDASDPTKQVSFDASGITTGNTRSITAADVNISLSPSGTGSFAAINLSNVSTYATSMTPDVTGTRSLGTAANRLAQIWSDSFAGRFSISERFHLEANITTPVTGITGLGALYDPLANSLAVYTSNRGSSGSGALYFETGNNGGTTFGAGIINIQTGSNTSASNAATNGGINLITGSHAGTGTSGGLALSTGANTGGGNEVGAASITTGNASGTTGTSGSISITAGNIANTSNTGTAGGISITAGSSNTNTSGAGGSVTITSGATTSGGNSAPAGNIILIASASVGGGGAHGKIKFQDGTQGTVNHVWTQTVSDGTGSWQVAPATGANTALSNLASVAINTTLQPDGNNSRQLGGSSFQWNPAYILRTFSLFSS